MKVLEKIGMKHLITATEVTFYWTRDKNFRNAWDEFVDGIHNFLADPKPAATLPYTDEKGQQLLGSLGMRNTVHVHPSQLTIRASNPEANALEEFYNSVRNWAEWHNRAAFADRDNAITHLTNERERLIKEINDTNDEAIKRLNASGQKQTHLQEALQLMRQDLDYWRRRTIGAERLLEKFRQEDHAELGRSATPAPGESPSEQIQPPSDWTAGDTGDGDMGEQQIPEDSIQFPVSPQLISGVFKLLDQMGVGELSPHAIDAVMLSCGYISQAVRVDENEGKDDDE